MRIFLLLVLSWLVVSCNNLKTDKYRSKKSDSVATRETAENVVIDYTDSGLKRATIKTPQMVGVKNVREPYVEMSKGINVDFFDMGGAVESYVTAEYAISYSKKKKIILRRKVEVVNVKGDTLNTEELIWDQNSERITTDKFVVIKTKSQTIWGDGMSSDQTFSDWEIMNVRGTINKSSK